MFLAKKLKQCQANELDIESLQNAYKSCVEQQCETPILGRVEITIPVIIFSFFVGAMVGLKK